MHLKVYYIKSEDPKNPIILEIHSSQTHQCPNVPNNPLENHGGAADGDWEVAIADAEEYKKMRWIVRWWLCCVIFIFILNKKLLFTVEVPISSAAKKVRLDIYKCPECPISYKQHRNLTTHHRR